MEALYHHIFDISEVPFYPSFLGYSYGFLLLDHGIPAFCFSVDTDTDNHLQDLFENGAIEFVNCSDKDVELFYGFVTDEMIFYCEEKLFPKDTE